MPSQNYSKCNNLSFKQNEKIKWILCRDFDEQGNIETECPNVLKKNANSITSTWSDGDSDQEEHIVTYVVLTTSLITDNSVSVQILQDDMKNINIEEDDYNG